MGEKKKEEANLQETKKVFQAMGHLSHFSKS